MPEQPSVLPFPRWLIAVDLVAALFVVAGLLLRNGVLPAGALPPGSDVLLLAIGALGIAGCAVQIMRFVRSANASRTSR